MEEVLKQGEQKVKRYEAAPQQQQQRADVPGEPALTARFGFDDLRGLGNLIRDGILELPLELELNLLNLGLFLKGDRRVYLEDAHNLLKGVAD